MRDFPLSTNHEVKKVVAVASYGMSSSDERAFIPPDQVEKAKEAIRVLSTIQVTGSCSNVRDQEERDTSNG